MAEEGQGVWTELSLRVRPEAVEAVAEALQEITGAGVTIEPPIQALGPDEGYVLDAKASSTLRAYLYGQVGRARRDAVRRRLSGDGLSEAIEGRIRWRTIREEDWAEAWKTYYDIERVGRVVIRPAWREYTPAPGEVVVSLDPGMAFGTGQHPTTRMCLEALQQATSNRQQRRLQEPGTGNKEPGLRVLDLGCGSGILALAAVGLGAGPVIAVDTEEMAVKATRSNLALNDASGRIEVVHGSLADVEERGPFDLILANINATTITALALELAESLAADGTLVAGGIIAERESGCVAALEAAGLRVERRLEEGEWRTFVVRHW
jgi:ribosomal protein L11 methyltransferase